MLPCSGDHFAIPHDPNPLGEDVLAAVGGYLYVDLSPIALELRWHLGVAVVVSEAADLGFAGVYCSCELVNALASFGKPLVGDSCALSHGCDEAICDGMRCVGKVVVLHAEDGFSRARGYRRVVCDTFGGEVYVEWGWRRDFLDRWSGGVGHILD